MMADFESDGTPTLSPDHSQHLDMVKEGGYTYFADITTFELEVAKNCDLAIMKEKFAPLLYAIGTQNNSVYIDMFSEQ